MLCRTWYMSILTRVRRNNDVQGHVLQRVFNYSVWKPDVKQQDYRSPLLDFTLSSANLVIVFLPAF